MHPYGAHHVCATSPARPPASLHAHMERLRGGYWRKGAAVGHRSPICPLAGKLRSSRPRWHVRTARCPRSIQVCSAQGLRRAPYAAATCPHPKRDELSFQTRTSAQTAESPRPGMRQGLRRPLGGLGLAGMGAGLGQPRAGAQLRPAGLQLRGRDATPCTPLRERAHTPAPTHALWSLEASGRLGAGGYGRKAQQACFWARITLIGSELDSPSARICYLIAWRCPCGDFCRREGPCRSRRCICPLADKLRFLPQLAASVLPDRTVADVSMTWR